MTMAVFPPKIAIPGFLCVILYCVEFRLVSSLPVRSWPDARVRVDRPNDLSRKIINDTSQCNWIKSRFHRLTRHLASEDIHGASGIFRRNILKVIGGTIVAAPAALEVFSRIGSREDGLPEIIVPEPLVGTLADLENLTLIFHGAGGEDKFTDKLMENLKIYDSKTSFSTMITWEKYSSNILQASFNGQRIGRYVAQQLLNRASNLKSLHVIGISVGAFAADSVGYQVKTSLEHAIDVQLTLLDPFTQRGIFDVGYGARKFGEKCDYFQQYLNTDDPVPSTNAPLETSVCYDVTAIRPQEVSFGHDWPVAYYGQQKQIGIVPKSQRLPRGTLIKVTSE